MKPNGEGIEGIELPFCTRAQIPNPKKPHFPHRAETAEGFSKENTGTELGASPL